MKPLPELLIALAIIVVLFGGAAFLVSLGGTWSIWIAVAVALAVIVAMGAWLALWRRA